MRRTLMSYLVCPACRTDLSLSVNEEHRDHIERGSLSCNNCGVTYPIVGGIPRMIVRPPETRSAAETFGFEWEHHATGDLEGTTVFGRTAQQDRDLFLEAVDIGPYDVRGQVVL